MEGLLLECGKKVWNCRRLVLDGFFCGISWLLLSSF